NRGALWTRRWRRLPPRATREAWREPPTASSHDRRCGPALVPPAVPPPRGLLGGRGAGGGRGLAGGPAWDGAPPRGPGPRLGGAAPPAVPRPRSATPPRAGLGARGPAPPRAARRRGADAAPALWEASGPRGGSPQASAVGPAPLPGGWPAWESAPPPCRPGLWPALRPPAPCAPPAPLQASLAAARPPAPTAGAPGPVVAAQRRRACVQASPARRRACTARALWCPEGGGRQGVRRGPRRSSRPARGVRPGAGRGRRGGGLPWRSTATATVRGSPAVRREASPLPPVPPQRRPR